MKVVAELAALRSTARQNMASRALTFVLGIAALAANSSAVAEDGLCKPLRQFIASVKPEETQVVKFHTSWGSNFKDDDEPALFAKRCDHGGHAAAKVVCDYLMQHGATEFSGNNAKSAVSCLSRETRFAPRAQIQALSISITVGTKDRGSLVDIVLAEDPDLGGMVLSITADGY